MKREGNQIYSEDKIEVRTFDRDPESHSIWIGENYFLFQRGCLEHFAMRTPARDLEKALGNYNPSLPYILKQERLTPESFGLILLRALKKEKEDIDLNYEKFKRENGL